jgi:putative membrane protein
MDDDIIKTVFDFYIIDLIIFSAIAGIFAFLITGTIWLFYTDAPRIILQIVAVLILIVLMYWNYKYRYKKKFKKSRSIEILKNRYAKGEITKEQFEEMKKELEQ